LRTESIISLLSYSQFGTRSVAGIREKGSFIN
jgi:hypothetical protein